MENQRPEVTIYTDGGCSPNPGPGGWAVLLIYGDVEKELSGCAPDTTNNQMELTAAIEALSALKKPCRVQFHTDSTYLRNGITKWMDAWKRNNWMTQPSEYRAAEPVKNRELWEKLDALTQKHDIKWHWVKAHAKDALNNRVDRLVAAARAKCK